MKLRLKLKWEPRDLWWGVYVSKRYEEWDVQQDRVESVVKLYVCFIPTLPLIIEVVQPYRPVKPEQDQ